VPINATPRWFHWEESFDVDIDQKTRRVAVRAPGTPVRTATYYGDQGCVIHARGSEDIHFTPVDITSKLPDPATQPWPTGDLDRHGPLPPGADTAAVTPLRTHGRSL
jgi:hypothetical protein